MDRLPMFSEIMFLLSKFVGAENTTIKRNSFCVHRWRDNKYVRCGRSSSEAEGPCATVMPVSKLFRSPAPFCQLSSGMKWYNITKRMTGVLTIVTAVTWNISLPFFWLISYFLQFGGSDLENNFSALHYLKAFICMTAVFSEITYLRTSQ